MFTGLALAAILLYLLFKKPARRLEYIAWLLVLAGGSAIWWTGCSTRKWSITSICCS